MFGRINPDDFHNPLRKELDENARKLESPAKIKRLESFKRLNDPDLSKNYELLKGLAIADKWVGDILDLMLDEVEIQVYKIKSKTDSFELIYQESDDLKHGSIIKVQWEPRDQGRFFKLQKHLDECAKYLFQSCGYNSFMARGSVPLDDPGVRGKKDRRTELVDWRPHRKTKKMIRLNRLTATWLKCKFVVPRQLISPDSKDDEIVWLNPWKLAEMTEKELNQLDQDMGDEHIKRWRLVDCKKYV